MAQQPQPARYAAPQQQAYQQPQQPAQQRRPLYGTPRPAARIMVNVPSTPADQQTGPAAQQGPTADAAGADPVRQKAFTDQQLNDAWVAYIIAHPHEHVVVNTMRMAYPKRVNDTLCEIEVQNPSQVEFIETVKPQLLAHLRDAVGNDMLALDVKISERGPSARMLTPREVVEEIQKNNPAFTQFIKDYQLGLA